MADDSEIRTKILAAARGAVARQGKFTMREVCVETGLARGVVSRCFGGKEGLTAALVAEDLKNLSGIIASPLEQPASLAQAVGENVFYIDAAAATAAPVREPRIPRHGEIGRALEERQIRDVEGAMKAETEAGRAPDAWLERRLRVFERALNNIELREEKSERDRMGGLSELEEGVRQIRETLAQGEAQSRAAALELRAQLDEMTLRIGTLEIAQMDRAPAPQPLMPEPDLAPLAEPTPEQAEETPEEKREDAPDSFIAQARRSAQAAHIAAQSAEPKPAKHDKKQHIRWFIIAAVVLILIFASATIAFAKLAQSDAVRLLAVNGVVHRQVTLSPAERLRALADGGDARARTLIAQDYLRGDGLPQNDVAAARWSLLAAAQGQPVAQYMLGTLYQQGAGVASDPQSAFRWFQAAALQGNRKAMHNLAIAYAQGQGVQKDPQEAARWFARAAMLGYVDSQFDLAVLYERGEGVPQSLTDAYKWYAIAAAQGDAPSAGRLEVLRTQLSPADIAAAASAAKAFAPQPFSTAANIVPDKI